jgi:hypothetical protein
MVGFVVAIVRIGAAVGAWFAGPVSTRIGRNRVMLIAGALIMVGDVAVALSNHAVLLGLFRFMVGVGIGSASAVVPAYIAEVPPSSSASWRACSPTTASPEWAGSESESMPWRGLAVDLRGRGHPRRDRRRHQPPTPQSPQDLLRHGRDDPARKLSAKISDEPVEEQVTAINQTLAREQETAVTVKDLRGPRVGLPLVVWVGVFLAAYQQLIGVNVVKTYSSTLWKQSGSRQRRVHHQHHHCAHQHRLDTGGHLHYGQGRAADVARHRRRRHVPGARRPGRLLPRRPPFQALRRDKRAETYPALADFALRERTRTRLIQSDPVPASMEHMMPAAPTQPGLLPGTLAPRSSPRRT